MMKKMERYEAKARYIDRMNKENSENTNLTQDQHDAIQTVCSMRHELHINLDGLLKSESSDFSTFNDWLIGESDDSLHMILKNVGIDNDLLWNPEDLPTDDSMWSEFYSDYDEFYESEYEVASDIHRCIENFIRDIDSKYGTSYAPTGFARIK